MSRVGKKPVNVTPGVTATVEGQVVTMKGPKGRLQFVVHDDVLVTLEGGVIKMRPRVGTSRARALYGTARAQIVHLLEGVTKGFEKKSDIAGIGFHAALQGKKAQLALGHSHDAVYAIPETVAVAAARQGPNFGRISKTSRTESKTAKTSVTRTRRVARPAVDNESSVQTKRAGIDAGNRTVRDVFLQRSLSAIERMSQRLSESAMAAALAAPTDIGALARVLADATVVDAATRDLDPFASALARSVQHREELIALSGGLLSASNAAQILGITRQAIDKRRQGKRLFGVKIAGAWGYPAFQFDDRVSTDDLKNVIEILDDPGGWSALDFLLTPDAVLGGKTPAETMQLGPEAFAHVLRLARAERSDGFS